MQPSAGDSFGLVQMDKIPLGLGMAKMNFTCGVCASLAIVIFLSNQRDLNDLRKYVLCLNVRVVAFVKITPGYEKGKYKQLKCTGQQQKKATQKLLSAWGTQGAWTLGSGIQKAQAHTLLSC